MIVSESAAGCSGDKLATFVEVAQKNRVRLLWVAWRMTKSREEAEDILQDALLKAFRALPQFRGDSRMDTWLHAIVRNMTLAHLRSRKGRVEFPLEPSGIEGDDIPAHEVPDPGESPQQYCERTERENLVRSSMNEMTATGRIALEMCVLQDLPYSDVASELHISLGTLKSRVFHGKRMLKKAVDHRLGLDRVSMDRVSIDRVSLDPASPDRVSIDRVSIDRISIDGISIDDDAILPLPISSFAGVENVMR